MIEPAFGMETKELAIVKVNPVRACRLIKGLEVSIPFMVPEDE